MISKIEMKILKWIEEHMWIFVLISVTIISYCIRHSLKDYEGSDAYWFLLPWYDEIKNAGGFASLSKQVGNYNILYQFLIALMTYIPIEPLYAYKILSCVFDYALGILIGFVFYDLSCENKRWYGILGYTLVVISPVVFINSSLWGQCDVIYVFFCIASLVAIYKEKYVMTFVLYGLAFSFKLQAIFLLPFLLFVYFVSKKFSLAYFFEIPLMLIVTAIPGLIMGRNVMDIVTIYTEQTTGYADELYMGYPSAWCLLTMEESNGKLNIFTKTAFAVTIVLLAMFMVIWIVKKINLTKTNMLYMAFILVYTCVLFLPCMHERYGYMCEIMALPIAMKNRETIPLAITMQFIALSAYGDFLFALPINVLLLSAINVLVYVMFVRKLMRAMSDSCNDLCAKV